MSGKLVPTAAPEFRGTERFVGGEEVDPDVLNEGWDLYMRYCYACHGEQGDGQGPVAPGLWPPPRDFTAGVFKFAGITDEYLPTDDELIRLRSMRFRTRRPTPSWRVRRTGSPRVRCLVRAI